MARSVETDTGGVRNWFRPHTERFVYTTAVPRALNPCIQTRYPLRMIFVEWRKGFVALCVRNYVPTVNLPVGLAACQLFRYQRDKSTLYAGTIVNWPGYRPTRSSPRRFEPGVSLDSLITINLH